MHEFCKIWTDIKKVIHSIPSDFKIRIIIYLLLVFGLFIGLLFSYYYDTSSLKFISITIIVAIASSAFEISSRIWSSTNDINDKMKKIDIKIDQIKEHGRLLTEGTAWYEGAKLISGLEKDEMILASNLVSWTKDSVEYYITENKEALKRGVTIKRLYANTPENEKLAKDQLKWVKSLGLEAENLFQRKMYDKYQPMIDHILAIDKNKIPKWAVLWIYSPLHASTVVPGFIIKDQTILDGLHKDFNIKWDHKEFTTEAPEE